MEYIKSQEHLVKEVIDRGNSGGVYLPKSWVGRQVIIRPLSVNEYILNALSPHMKDIVGIYLYGSYARGEQVPDSDIDVLIIADKKLPVKMRNGVDIEIVDITKIKDTLRDDPVGYHSIIKEAVPIMNEVLLNELKEVKLNTKNIKGYYKETESVLSMVRELLELKGDPSGSIYSLILRLRGLYLIKCNLGNRKYKNQGLEDFVVKRGISRDKYRKIYSIYRAKRDDKRLPPYKIPTKDIKVLYRIVDETLSEMKNGQEEEKGY